MSSLTGIANSVLTPMVTPVRFKTVVVVNPPSPPGYVANRDSMGGYGQLYPIGAPILPPLDVPYLVGYLESKNVPFEVLEAQGLSLSRDQLAGQVVRIAGSDPSERTLVVVRTALPSLDWDLSVCATIKSAAPNISIGVYGSIVSHVLHRVLQEPCVDYVLRGEPDDTVCELMSGRPANEILGLNYRSGGGWQETASFPEGARYSSISQVGASSLQAVCASEVFSHCTGSILADADVEGLPLRM